MVSIFTYRDERKLFALIATVIVASLIALVQLEYARDGKTSPLSLTITSLSAYAEIALSALTGGVTHAVDSTVSVPSLYVENQHLRAENARLRAQDDALNEQLAIAPSEDARRRVQERFAGGISATVIGYDPENAMRVVTIDRGTNAHVNRDDGVINDDGVVGRVIEVDPFTSKVLLITDVTSKLPSVVQHGRWWGIANGTMTRVKLQYVSQDAHLKIGDRVVTGEGRSFHAGILVGTIARIEPMPAGALDQSAIIEPAVSFGRLDHVLVLPK
ncbi:MAG TPA: rod shape-determining protein MreC [Candidatus Acidoferrales bacterium]|nr:rod shape-determining protein MreC [Candidatus Acidoferrales bacterium]